MPISHVAPAAAAPADRLSLETSAVRGGQQPSMQPITCGGWTCFADEDATPSAPPAFCGGYLCASLEN